MASKLKAEVLKYIPPLLYAPQTRDLCAEDVSWLQAEFPLPSWTFSRKGKDGTVMPQTIAHRGFKAEYPENTLLAFKQAVAVGADALETDVHVTRDGVAVLSHDGNLKRCFGKDENIIDCEWSYLSQLRTTQEPHEPMPRLADLLAYLAEPGMHDIWLLLDIKIDVEPGLMMSTIARSLAAAPAPASKPWNQRILLGIWGTSYLPLCARELPGYAVTNICFSTFYARQFLRRQYVSFNALAVAISLWPLGALFIRAAHARSRSVLAWTVNDERTMRWSIRSGLDGVITDDPRRFRAVSAEWRAGKTGDAALKRDQVFRAAWFNALGLVFAFVIWQWRVRERLVGRSGGRPKYKQLSGSGGMQNGRMT